MLLILPGCTTLSLWEGPLRSDCQRTTTSAVHASQAQLRQTDTGPRLYVRFEFGDGVEIAMALEPMARCRDAFAEVVCEPVTRPLTLRIQQDRTVGKVGAWQVSLETGPSDAAPAIALSGRILDLDTPALASGGEPFPLHEVLWTEVDNSTQVDIPGVAWRVAVTPFAVAADIVLAIPLALVLGYIALTDPGLLGGG